MDLEKQGRPETRAAARLSLVHELDQLRWTIQDGDYADALRRASDRGWLRGGELEHLPDSVVQRVQGWMDLVRQCLRPPVDADGASRALMHAVHEVERS